MSVPLEVRQWVPRHDPEQRLRALRRGFARVTRPLERRDRLHRMRRRASAVGRPLLVVAMIAFAGVAGLVMASPWPLGLTLRHLAAGVGCPVARAVGLAPARYGEPGWWPKLDADLDGWACEPLPRAQAHGVGDLR